MSQRYFSIPFSAKKFREGKHTKCDLQESVRQHVEMMLHTFPMDYRYSTTFGSALSKYHFTIPESAATQVRWGRKIKRSITDTLEQSLRKHEPRLINFEVMVTILKKDTESFPVGRIVLEVVVRGSLIDNSPFLFKDHVAILRYFNEEEN